MDNYYLEYSPIQKAFNIDTMDEIVNNNKRLIVRGLALNTCYLVIAGPGTKKEMQKSKFYFEKEFGRL